MMMKNTWEEAKYWFFNDANHLIKMKNICSIK